MDYATVRRAYRRHAPYYDAVFGAFLGRGRRVAIDTINRLSQRRILEVGVGTGVSLPRYRRDLQIVGIDISPEMLAKARRRVEEHGLANVEAIHEMDAENITFADSSFDVVAAMYVASVVPNPPKLLSEMIRVCKPGGDLIVVNHFMAEGGIRAAVERRLAPLSDILGWRPDFGLAAFVDGHKAHVIEHRHTDPFGMFTLVHFRCVK
ncbi:MAG: class I SAM-dependent methyltransferase [Rhodospirillales bacterium]|nr:class I SAM-dependent methyltransferase [Rhodospirillales bacterium]